MCAWRARPATSAPATAAHPARACPVPTAVAAAHPTDERTRLVNVDTVRLLVETGPSGRPVHEDVPAAREGGDWRLKASPGLAMGTAAGDLLRVGQDHAFDVLERGRNIAVHVSAPATARSELAALKNKLESMGGWCDGVGWTRDR